MTKFFAVLAMILVALMFVFAPVATATECVYGTVIFEGPAGGMPVQYAFVQVTGFVAGYRQQGGWGNTDPWGWFWVCVDGQLGPDAFDTLEIYAWGFDSLRIATRPVDPGTQFEYMGVLGLQEPLATVRATGGVANNRFTTTFTVKGGDRLGRGQHPVVASVISQGPGDYQVTSTNTADFRRDLKRDEEVTVPASITISPQTLRGEFVCHWLAVNRATASGRKIKALGQMNPSIGVCVVWDPQTPTTPVPLAFQSPSELATFQRDPMEFARRRERATHGIEAVRADQGF